MNNRLENLRVKLHLNWGELAEYIGISRSMLDFLRFEKREPSKNLMQRIEELEKEINKDVTTKNTTTQYDGIDELNKTMKEVLKVLERIAVKLENQSERKP